VIAAASSEDKLQVCKQAGADETIDYTQEDMRQRLKELAGEKGVDVVYDPVGGVYTEPALRATGWGGRYLVVGFASGEIPKIPLNLALLKERSVIGVYWGEWTKHDLGGHTRNVQQLVKWIAEERIKPLISERVSLHDTPAAMTRLTERKVKGKVVVLPEA
jgi:NADPH2:quinone reductase